MKIIELLSPGRILPSLQAGDKRAVIVEMAAALAKENPRLKQDKIVQVLLERESLGSTGIGDNIAIPHGKLADLDQLVLCFGRSLKGVNFDSIDGKPTHLFFLLLAPENFIGLHLKALAKISRMLKDTSFRRNLMAAPDAATIYDLIATEDAKY